MIMSLIQTAVFGLTFASSYFLLKVNLGLSPDTIAKTSLITHSGYNKEIVISLAKQSAYTYIGLRLLLLSFLFQMVYLLWPWSIDDIGPLNHWGILLSIIFCFIILILAIWYSKKLSDKLFIKSMHIIKKHLNQYSIN